jgi:Tol biopolymer transport system component
MPITILKIPAGRIQWSPDSKSIAYINSHQGVSNIYQQAIDGGGTPQQMTQFNSDQIFWFAISNDFKQIACSRGVITTDVVLIKNVNQK